MNSPENGKIIGYVSSIPLFITSRDRAIRNEALTFLGAMERAGSDDAEWALDATRKKGSPPSK